MSLTYLQFHALFVLPALAVLWVAVRRLDRRTGLRTWRRRRAAIALLVVIAILYTAPWGSYLIERGVWWYGEGRVLARIWNVPVEEFLFMALQSIAAGLWLTLLPTVDASTVRVRWRDRLVGLLAGLAVGAVGWALLGASETYYLGAILLWSGPVLALQWGVGWPALWRLRRTLALGVLVPSAYLWVADWIAIDAGVWVISGVHTTGLTLAGLPIEEATFFLVTNLFVVQGLLLFDWVIDRWG
jgi:lycopene cyclase domain-containing protein